MNMTMELRLNQFEINSFIEKLHKSDLFGCVIENGCGCSVANKLLSVSGASKTIYKTEVPYSKDVMEQEYNYHSRAVSIESVKSMIEKYNQFNFVYGSSFQINNDGCMHGWIGIKIYNNIKYYHVYFGDKKLARDKQIDLLSNFGLYLIFYQCGYITIDEFKVYELQTDSTLFYFSEMINVVAVQNDVLEINYEETLKFIDIQNKGIAVFKPSENGVVLGRFEDVFRDKDSVTIVKGSFNPPTLVHELMLNYVKDAVANISLNTKDKGHQNYDSVIQRIKYLTGLGYTVLINRNQLFSDLIECIEYFSYKGKINFVLGIDTLNRLLDDSSNNWQSFIETFKNTHFIVFSRDNLSVKYILNNFISFELYENKLKEISSTNVRELIKNEGIDSKNLKNYLSEKMINILENEN
jgi:nicotinic acid mononucleotide adenylyltransferase